MKRRGKSTWEPSTEEERLRVAQVAAPVGYETRRRPRPGKCFDAASNYVTDLWIRHGESGLYLGGVRLVHGTYFGNLSHAWVELRGGVIYDGARGKFYKWIQYERIVRAKSEVKYKPKEAASKLIESRHVGPWHNSRGLSAENYRSLFKGFDCDSQ